MSIHWSHKFYIDNCNEILKFYIDIVTLFISFTFNYDNNGISNKMFINILVRESRFPGSRTFE